MGHALSATGGLRQARNESVPTKHLHVAWAAQRGVEAALLAKADLPGPRFILEGPQGIFAAMASGGSPGDILSDPDHDVMPEVSFKPWPACRHAHPAIDAALALNRRLGGRRVRAARVETYSDAITYCDKPAPRTRAEANFSLQHAVAVTLLSGRPRLADFAGGAIDAPEVAALRARVTVSASPDLTLRYPARFGAAVTVETDGGETLAETAADARGDPENPMDEAAVLAKFTTLAEAAGLSGGEIAQLRTCVLDLATGRPLADLRAAIARIRFPEIP
jgi:2-methylcitrate dehydratase PrpD